MPQLEVGHLQRMERIDRRLSTLPGLFLSASGFRGVGLPDCIKDANAVAERVAGFLNPSLDTRGARSFDDRVLKQDGYLIRIQRQRGA